MSQQGGRPTGPTGPEDEWWRQLYDDSADDTGPTAAPDSLDDRFASASGTVARRPAADTEAPAAPPPDPVPPGPRSPWWASPTNPPDIPGPRSGGPAGADGPRRTGDEPSRAGGPPRPTDSTGAGDDATRAGPLPPAGPSEGGDDAPRGVRGPGSAPVPHAGGDAVRDSGSVDPAGPPRGDGGLPGGGGPPPPADPARRDADAGPGGIADPRPPARPRPGAPWEPRPATPSGPVDLPAGDERSGTGALPGNQRPGTTPPAAAPQVPGVAEPPAPVPPAPASGGRGRGGEPRGLTTSGTGAADLTEPPAAVPPPRTASGLPPLPPAFLPSRPTEPDGADRDYVGSGPPTYDAEPTALPPADPDGLDGLVPDTVLEGARYGTCTLRAVSVRGDSARYRGEPRRDALLVARFGAGEQALVLVAMATGARATAGAHRAAAEVCRWIGRAVGRSHARLAEDLRAARRGDLKSGLHRLTDRSLGRLRAGAAEQGLEPHEYAATLRCLLLPADPGCRTRVFFGVGAGGLLRLRDGEWQDMEPDVGDVTGEPVLGFGSAPRGTPGSAPGGTLNDAPGETPDGDRLTMDLGVTTPPGPYDGPPAEPPREPFRFRASVARPGDVLLMCTAGLAEPLLNEPGLGELLARRWTGRPAPGLGEFLADGRVRVKGYADDRTAAAVWEA
ncbi:protein phosphatase 2C domain-containing protein [Streptomyces sp. R1]|uniref:protein phosphatase 2C domain-containing protein n=1 Tax=Streptomyces sp. R1 TaxID=1509279 RepID=UPI001E366562|nr:protein phosphatase 2C domain-containing protein [Streptomyces sp. R1]MCC8337053.1 protein phosphatase 2C domain-containing protein [Streptomyces sp. R1]